VIISIAPSRTTNAEIGTLISDLLLMWIDPRIRLGQLR